MGRKMMENEVFRQSIMKSDEVLKPYNINLYDMLMEGEEATFENTVNSFVGIAAIQVEWIQDHGRNLRISAPIVWPAN